MSRHFDHVDLRVPDLCEAAAFYEMLLPSLGFSRRVEVEGWLQFEAEGDGVTEFFGVTESRQHKPNENRIAFWAQSPSHVQSIAKIAIRAGALHMEGPMDYEAGYYAVFFEDPWGNRLEVCFRDRNAAPKLREG